MDQLRIIGNGNRHDTYIADSDGKLIKGLHVEKIEIVMDATVDGGMPQAILTLCPGTVDLDFPIEVDEIQKDILAEFANKLFIIQDSLHGKSLDTVQNEIFEIQRQIEMVVKDDPPPHAKYNIEDLRGAMNDAIENDKVSPEPDVEIQNTSIYIHPEAGPGGYKCYTCSEIFIAKSKREAICHVCKKDVPKELLVHPKIQADAMTQLVKNRSTVMKYTASCDERGGPDTISMPSQDKESDKFSKGPPGKLKKYTFVCSQFCREHIEGNLCMELDRKIYTQEWLRYPYHDNGDGVMVQPPMYEGCKCVLEPILDVPEPLDAWDITTVEDQLADSNMTPEQLLAVFSKCSQCGVDYYDDPDLEQLANHVCSAEDIERYKTEPNFRKIYCNICNKLSEDCKCHATGGIVNSDVTAIMGESGSEIKYKCNRCDSIFNGETAVSYHQCLGHDEDCPRYNLEIGKLKNVTIQCACNNTIEDQAVKHGVACNVNLYPEKSTSQECNCGIESVSFVEEIKKGMFREAIRQAKEALAKANVPNAERQIYCPRCDMSHFITDSFGKPMAIPNECIAAISVLDTTDPVLKNKLGEYLAKKRISEYLVAKTAGEMIQEATVKATPEGSSTREKILGPFKCGACGKPLGTNPFESHVCSSVLEDETKDSTPIDPLASQRNKPELNAALNNVKPIPFVKETKKDCEAKFSNDSSFPDVPTVQSSMGKFAEDIKNSVLKKLVDRDYDIDMDEGNK